MQPEIFKDVIGYEGLYQVSDIGSVYSLVTSRVLRPCVHRQGYHQVELYKDGVQKTYKVHRLVALNFLQNPEGKSDVNHIDGVKTNNYLSNLEWNTRKENMVHSSRVLGNKHGTRGDKNPSYGKLLGDHSTARLVIQYDLYGNELERFTSITGASLATGVNRGHITQVCKCKLKSAGGFRWKYA